MSTSSLLAALIASSVATNGMITVGDTQPFDQVRLYQNPANDTVLTNQSTDGLVDASTTALVITGSTAPTGLVFEPNLGVLRNVTSDIKLLVDTPVELTLALNLAGSLTEMTVEAGKTAVLTLGLIAGIPMIVGAFGFFPVASHADAVTGALFSNAVYVDGALQYIGGQVVGFTVNSMFARFDLSVWQRVTITVPADSYAITVILSADPNHNSAFNDAIAMTTIEGSVESLSSADGVMVFAGQQFSFSRIDNRLAVLIDQLDMYQSQPDSSLDGLDAYLYVFVTGAGAGLVPVINMQLTPHQSAEL